MPSKYVSLKKYKQYKLYLIIIIFVSGTGGPSVVTEGKDALLTCVIMGPYSNDTVLWRRGADMILSAGMNRVTNDKRISILHDECKLIFTFFFYFSRRKTFSGKVCFSFFLPFFFFDGIKQIFLVTFLFKLRKRKRKKVKCYNIFNKEVYRIAENHQIVQKGFPYI